MTVQTHPGDKVRVHAEGDRRPPLIGVVRSTSDTTGLLIVERTDDGGIACIPACLDIEVLEPATT